MNKRTFISGKIVFCILLSALALGIGAKNVFAQTDQSSLYVPLIGITSVPEPLALPNGPGEVTYNYAVKNFLSGSPLTGVQVVDNGCSPVKFVSGDDNNDLNLDFNETWRYSCTTEVSTTTQSIATATGISNNFTAMHKAYATVVVGLKTPPPLVSIVNVTKVANPLSLPAEGGPITFTYKVNNPGVVPLSNVIVSDDKCGAMSGELGDTNGNGLLDINEVWIYTCTMVLKETTTNTVTVTALANGFQAIGSYTLTVYVKNPILPNTGLSSVSTSSFNIVIWSVLLGILAGLIVFFFIARKNRDKKQS